MARLLAARGLERAQQIRANLSDLLAPQTLTNNTSMANLLADAIAADKALLVIGDYDADGATASAGAACGTTTASPAGSAGVSA